MFVSYLFLTVYLENVCRVVTQTAYYIADKTACQLDFCFIGVLIFLSCLDAVVAAIARLVEQIPCHSSRHVGCEIC